ncbi:MAG: metal-dependent transcriptional regulator [Promethearchaeota archaeon]
MSDLDFKVLSFLFENKKPLKISQISESINVKHSTVGSCVKRLMERGLVDYKPFHEVKLTDNGKELAIELERHAHLLELFLHKELGLTPQEALKESKKINLLLSCKIINKICEKYGHPKKCSCGIEIYKVPRCTCGYKDSE